MLNSCWLFKLKAVEVTSLRYDVGGLGSGAKPQAAAAAAGGDQCCCSLKTCAASRTLLAAVESGHVQVVKLLLSDRRVHPGACANRAIALAVALGQLDVVTTLLGDKRVQPCDGKRNALHTAIITGQAAVVAHLLTDKRVKVESAGRDLLLLAAHHGQPDVFNAILSSPRLGMQPFAASGTGGSVLCAMALMDNAESPALRECVARFLADPRVACDFDAACIGGTLQVALLTGNTALAALLSAHESAAAALRSPVAVCHWLQRLCSQYGGDYALLSRLLAHPKVDLSPYLSELVTEAASMRSMPALDSLLASPRFDAATLASAASNALLRAVAAGHAPVVKRLLSSPHANPAGFGDLRGSALHWAACWGNTAVVDCLLRDPRPDAAPADDVCKTLGIAVAAGNLSLVKRLLADARADPTVPDTLTGCQPLMRAAAAGHAAVVQCLLADPRVDSAALQCRALRDAARNGHVTVVEHLLADPRVDPTLPKPTGHRIAAVTNFFNEVEQQDALTAAASRGHLVVMQRLLADPRVDAGAKGCAALREAASGMPLKAHLPLGKIMMKADDATFADLAAKHPDALKNTIAAVKRLLADPRCDPSTPDTRGVCADAAVSGQVQVLEAFLADPRVDPAASNNYMLRLAAVNGRLAAVQRLLADPRVDPSASDNDALRAVARADADTLPLLKLLLADPRVDPSARRCEAFKNFARVWHAGAVKLLLADPRIDARMDDNEALRNAVIGPADAQSRQLLPSTAWRTAEVAQQHQVQVVQLLLTACGVDLASEGNKLLTLAVGSGRTGLAAWLLSDDDVRCAFKLASASSSTADRLVTIFARAHVPLPHAASLLPHYLRVLASHRPPARTQDASQLRLVVDAASIGAAAWARRRAVVMARAIALMPDSPDSPDSSDSPDSPDSPDSGAVDSKIAVVDSAAVAAATASGRSHRYPTRRAGKRK